MKRIAWLVIILTLAACQTYESADTTRVALDQGQLKAKRTALLAVKDAKVLLDNDQAFEAKLSLITNAVSSVDMMYPAINNDYSTALFVRTLLGATQRGVNVRLLVDYQKGYRQLAFLLMLEHWGNQGEGSLDVRLFNRPNKDILRDALAIDVCYQQLEACNKERLEWVDQQIERGELNPGAALLLSGIAADHPGIVGVALEQDPQATTAQNINRYFNRRHPLFDEMAERELYQAVLGSAEVVLPLSQQLAEGLPKKALTLSSDWAYASTSILNHRLLLVDSVQLQLGRSLRDAYHINPHELSEPLTFTGWDVALTLEQPSEALVTSIDRLWNASFSASLSEIREQIPDATVDAINQAIALCQSLDDQQCLNNSAAQLADQPLSEKIYGQYQKMQENAQLFEETYQVKQALPVDPKTRPVTLSIDPSATMHYLENVPFYRDDQDALPMYGAVNGEELKFGKSVHAIIIPAMRSVCESAQGPKDIIIYSDSALLPANLLTELAQMSDGRVPCANVSVSIVSNSAESSENPVKNLLARVVMQSLLAHQSSVEDNANAAKITYFEMVSKQTAQTSPSINTNVFIVGDDGFIGSTMANVRGFMADTSSGLYIQNSPRFISQLTQQIKSHANDDTVFTQHTVSSLRAMKRSNNKILNQWLAKQVVSNAAKQPQKITTVTSAVKELLQTTSRLSKRIVNHHGRSESEQLEYNRLLSVM